MIGRGHGRSGLALGAAALTAVAALSTTSAGAGTGVSPTRLDAICRVDHVAAKAWSRRVPPIESDEDMALWETGIARFFTGTAQDLRVAGAPALATGFRRVAGGHCLL